MHDVLNQLADTDGILLRDPEEIKAYFTALLDSLLGLTGGLTMGQSNDRMVNQSALVKDKGELTRGVRELLEKISGARIGESALPVRSHKL